MKFSKLISPYQRLAFTRIQHQQQQRAAFHFHPALAMKTARVKTWGSPPEFLSGPDLPPPSSTQLQLKVVAAGVARAVRARAGGKHPTAFDAPLPFDPSIDGVGLDESTGDLYFINPLAAPLFAERANVERNQLMKLESGADPVSVAALANPVSSSWLALRCRAVGGCQGRTVVIIGATSASGRAAAVVARSLGAARVVGMSRSEETLAGVEGLDHRVLLHDVLPPSVGPVHIVLDYVGGHAAVGVLQTAEVEPGENLQYIQVGGLAGLHGGESHMLRLLPEYLINLKPICLMGSGMGSFTKEDLKREMPGLVSTITKMKRPVDVFTASLSDVQSAWESEDTKSKRLVVVPNN